MTTRPHVTYIKTTLPDVIGETKQSVHSISRFSCFFSKFFLSYVLCQLSVFDSRNAQGSGATAARVGRIKFYEDRVVTPRKSTSQMKWPGDWTNSNMSSRAPATSHGSTKYASHIAVLLVTRVVFCGCAAKPLVFASTGV